MSTTGNNRAIGYANPPKAHQFKPGQSGNPNGRPKGSRGLKQVVRTALANEVDLIAGGKDVTMTKREIIVHRLVQKAANDDFRAIGLVLNLDLKFDIAEEARDALHDPAQLEAEYREILDRYVVQLGADEQDAPAVRKSRKSKKEAGHEG
ncbi:DUF5681 domain-containing protein [Hyphobacterium sp.]|uniref:DUF5681 domain-containing protein n=1 Tax=Hyphobacterium sp. TaxID=2004662 RepID=UPI0037499593